MALAEVSLDDKYTRESGRIYLTGIQALVRLPMLQRQRDRTATSAAIAARRSAAWTSSSWPHGASSSSTRSCSGRA